MDLTGLKEPLTATGSDLTGSSFTGVPLRDARFDYAENLYLVSDLIAAYRKNV